MIADIASGEVDTADVLFLIATFLAIVAALLYALRRADTVIWAPVVGWVSVGIAWLAFLVL